MSFFVSPTLWRAIPGEDALGGATTVALNGSRVLAHTTAGAVTVKAPTPAAEGMFFLVTDADANAAANAITVDGNGALVDGAATLVLSTNSISAAFLFDGGQWRRCLAPRLLSDASPFAIFRQTDVGAGGATPTGNDGEIQTKSGSALLGATRVKAGVGFVSIVEGAGDGNPAASGAGRLSYVGKIRGRNSLDTIDLDVIGLDGSNRVVVGGFNTTTVKIQTANTDRFYVDSTAVQIAADGLPFIIGSTNPAGSGDFRNRNAATWKFRNFPNNADLTHSTVSTADGLIFWGTTSAYGDVVFNTPNIQNVVIQDAAIYRLFVKSSALGIAVPVKGDGASAAMPFRWGFTSITAVNGDQTLSAAQYECIVLIVAGTPAMPVGLVAPNTQGSFYIIDNTCGQTVTIKKSGGAGVAVLTGKRALVYHNGTDYVRLTPDT